MTTEKLIINVGRQLGSGGRIIAALLAEEFGCKLYDRELLNLAAKESGFSEKFFEQNDEKKGFTKSIFNCLLPLFGEHSFYGNNFSQESLFKFQSDAILQAAEEGNCVFVGRCADYVLRNFSNTVSIFVTADLNNRIDSISKRYDCEKQKAKELIERTDNARAAYYNYYTSKTWGHGTSYDLCINSSILGIEETAKFVADFIKKKN